MGSTGRKRYSVLDLQSLGIKWQPSMSRLTQYFQQSVRDQVGAMYSEFPELQGVITNIKVVNNVRTDMGFVSKGSQAGTIIISGDFANKPISQLGISRAFTADNYSQLVTHEMAHAVTKLLGANPAVKAFRGLTDSSSLSKLSDYARDMNDEEKFAEAVTDYMIHGNRAAQVSKEVVANVKRLLRG